MSDLCWNLFVEHQIVAKSLPEPSGGGRNLMDIDIEEKSREEHAQMNGKIVLVTGASGGLGIHVTQVFLDAGATVIGTSRKIQQSDFKSPSFVSMPGEMSNQEGTTTMIEQLLARFKKIDVLVHTVGSFAGGQSIAETDDATFQRMFDVNLKSAFYLLRAALPAMRKTGNGRIIAMGSRAAVDPGPGVGAYSASKAALVSLIRTVAAENKDVGITANVILPGTMDTPTNRKMIPNADVSKWVQPANVASLVLWLAGDSGADVSGSVIPVYGKEA
jgi:NAD(P)-dependent dehydrogenase (short-subunit alcohol dehydrogenase family)